MSDKVQLPKKKAGTNPGRLVETQDAPPTAGTPRKRKAGRKVGDREPSSPHAATEPTPRGVTQGRRSDRTTGIGPARPAAPERQRQRHPQTVPGAHRRVSADMRSRKTNMSNPSSRPLRRASVAPGPPRTMLQHAWHTVLNSDPLVDSDEDCPDEHLRLDYDRRVQVITRLRGRPPTPEVERSQPTPT